MTPEVRDVIRALSKCKLPDSDRNFINTFINKRNRSYVSKALTDQELLRIGMLRERYKTERKERVEHIGAILPWLSELEEAE